MFFTSTAVHQNTPNPHCMPRDERTVNRKGSIIEGCDGRRVRQTIGRGTLNARWRRSTHRMNFATKYPVHRLMSPHTSTSILAVNSGSSSLKVTLFALDEALPRRAT